MNDRRAPRAASNARCAPRAASRLHLQLIVERRELRDGDSQSRRDQPVREPHVLGQQRTVQIGADHIAAARALEAALPVVAVPFQDPPQRLLAGAELRAPSVVLEAREYTRARRAARRIAAALLVEALKSHLDRDIADQTRRRGSLADAAHGAHVEQADARQPLAGTELIGAAQQL